jgi:pimeloyl-ACP methyl ester carboxylesterase
MTMRIANGFPSSSHDRYLLARHSGQRPPAPAWFSDALAQKPERTHFLSQGAQIELLCWGKVGQPGLLFLPGNGAHADWWSPIAPFFAQDFRCAALSWSGMGRSDRRAEGYPVSVLAQEARDAVVAGELDRAGPPILVGHSLGGILGLHAVTGGQQANGLILIDSPIAMSRERAKEMLTDVPKSHAAHRPFASLDEGLARFRLSPPQSCANDYMVDHIARLSLIPEGDDWFWHFDPRRVRLRDSGRPPIERVTCPLAFLYGDRSDLLDSDTLACAVAVLPKGTPVVPIPDAAHHVPLDQPLALIAAMRTLLACWPHTGQGWDCLTARVGDGR